MQAIATMKRFTRSSNLRRAQPTLLNNTLVQLIIVTPATFACGVQELVGILPGSRETFHHAAIQHVLGALSCKNLLEEPLPDNFHHFTLGLELGARHHRT